MGLDGYEGVSRHAGMHFPAFKRWTTWPARSGVGIGCIISHGVADFVFYDVR